LYEYRVRLQNDDFGKYLLKVGFFEDQVGLAVRSLGYNFGSAIAIMLFFFFIVWVTRGRGMGGGDIRLGLLVGLVNGFPYNLLAVFLGFFIGAVVSIGLVLTRKKTLKSVVPFGPFLILGSLICFVWGSEILNWYLNLF
jgi:prepilin signal peptidase PulO-like enzyme (type II secretory pathway)